MGWWESSQLTPEGPAVAVFSVLVVGKPSPPLELREGLLLPSSGGSGVDEV